ncbi:MAG: hypothetical protein J0H91_16765 [Rhodospirillales bacterium]|nr:hypothetical protein [Rhodospirillales bacterium]
MLAGLAASAVARPAAAQALDMSGGGPVEVTARGGFEWHQAESEVIAEGDARAVRGDVTVLADRLVARYRKKAGAAPAAAAPAAGTVPGLGGDTGDTEVYRLEAHGHVRIFTKTDEAVGDNAVYDMDQAVLVLTGHDLKLTMPQQVVTARDSLEYWSQKRMAVGRGNAVVVTADGRRLAADTLVGYLAPAEAAPDEAAGAAPPAAGAPAAAGKLERVEGFGNVEVRTATDTVRGDRGVYVADTGIARVLGHVRITHGQNQINGPAADVNMKTGVAHILAGPAGRVQGLIVPEDAKKAGTPPPAPAAPPAGARK